MRTRAWWRPGKHDLDGHEPLPEVVELSPDYSLELPLQGDGEIAWQRTGFSPELLDRLAAWQEEFEAGFRWEIGWRSAEMRDRWAGQAGRLAADMRAELGDRAEVSVRLWPLRDSGGQDL